MVVFDRLGAIGCRFAEEAVGPGFIIVPDSVAASTEAVFAMPAEFRGRLDFPLFKPGKFFVQVQAVQIHFRRGPLPLADGARC